MSPSWTKSILRISGLQCNFEKDTFKVLDTWSEFGFNTEQLFHPMADCYASAYSEHKHQEIIKEYTKKAHQKGIKIILYFNVHILGPSLEQHSHEWSQRDKDNNIIKMYNGAYPSICLNSPWKDFFQERLDELNKIGIDGIFLDGPVIAENGCYCDHCKTEIKGTQLNIEQLNSWDFKHHTMVKFLNQSYQKWKTLNQDRIFYINLDAAEVHRQYLTLETAHKYNDIMGTEGGFMPYTPFKDMFFWRVSFSSKLLDSVSRGKPKVVFMAGDHKPWSWWLHTAAETQLAIMSSIANGSGIWYGMHSKVEFLKSETGTVLNKTMNFLKKYDTLLQESKSIAKVALVYSFTSEKINTEAEESDFKSGGNDDQSFYGNMKKSFRGYFQMLTESQIHFDIIHEESNEEQWKQYDTIILPAYPVITAEMVSRIEAHVKQGGSFITEFESAFFNGQKKPLESSPLSAILGIELEKNCSKHNHWNYFNIKDIDFQLSDHPGLFPLPYKSIPFKVDRANVLGEKLNDIDSCYLPLSEQSSPFISLNKYFKGNAFYLSGNIGEMYHDFHPPEYRTLLSKFIQEANKPLVQIQNPTNSLELNIRQNQNGFFVFLTNYQGGPQRPYSNISTIKDLNFQINLKNVQSVKSLYLDKCLESSDRWFQLPSLKAFDILHIKSD